MMNKARKWVACLAAVLLVFQAVPALMDEGTTYVSNVTTGTLAGFRDTMEIIGNGGYMLAGEEMTLTTNEDYAPVWESSNSDVVVIEEGNAASHAVTVRAVGFGTADIVAVDGNQTKVFAVTVIDPEGVEKGTAAGTETQEGQEKPEGTEGQEGIEGGETAANDESKQKIIIVINGGNLVTPYNGEEQSLSEYTATSNSAGFDASKVKTTREITVTGKDCGYYMMNLTNADFSYDDPAVKAIFVVNDGKMKITPAKATVTADFIRKVVGTEDPELTATVEGTYGDDTLEYTLTRDEGEAEDFYRITVTGEELQGNYRVKFANGFMTITAEEATGETQEDAPVMGIHVSSSWPEGVPAYPGTMITLRAELIGFEGKTYTLQWQRTSDQTEWTDEPGATGDTFTYELNDETANYTWRVVARDVQ